MYWVASSSGEPILLPWTAMMRCSLPVIHAKSHQAGYFVGCFQNSALQAFWLANSHEMNLAVRAGCPHNFLTDRGVYGWLTLRKGRQFWDWDSPCLFPEIRDSHSTCPLPPSFLPPAGRLRLMNFVKRPCCEPNKYSFSVSRFFII